MHPRGGGEEGVKGVGEKEEEEAEGNARVNTPGREMPMGERGRKKETTNDNFFLLSLSLSLFAQLF